MQGIANPRSKLAQSHYSKGRHKKERLGNVSIAWIIRVGATGSNLRPIAPKSLAQKTLYLRFEAINLVIKPFFF